MALFFPVGLGLGEPKIDDIEALNIRTSKHHNRSHHNHSNSCDYRWCSLHVARNWRDSAVDTAAFKAARHELAQLCPSSGILGA